MASLILFSLLLAAFFTLTKKNPSNRWWKLSTLVSINILIIEAICFIFLLYFVSQSKSLFIVGSQYFLDAIIKNQLINDIYITPSEHQGFYKTDSDVGYNLGKNKSYYRYRSSAQGLRGTTNYQPIPPENKLRVAVFGDSFVFCDGEQEENTWPFILERSMGNLEVLNFGVSGYGLGLSYLRYVNDALQFHPDVIVFNYVLLGRRDLLENDMLRGLTLKQSPMYSSYFTIKDDLLLSESFTPGNFFDESFRKKRIYDPFKFTGAETLLTTPLFSFFNSGLLFKNFYLQKKYLTIVESDREEQVQLKYNLKIVEEILATAKRNKTNVIFTVSESFESLPHPLQKLLKDNESFVSIYNINNLISKTQTALKIDPKKTFNRSSHYNSIGNHLYANGIALILKHRAWGAEGRVFSYSPENNSFLNLKNR